MINFFICLIISVMSSLGLAIILVEKGEDYPVNKVTVPLRDILKTIFSEKASKVLDCTTCTSFWTTLWIDLVVGIICFLGTGSIYFFWPFSGFITAGFAWFMIEFLNSIDRGESNETK